jgi:hypothetical protein
MKRWFTISIVIFFSLLLLFFPLLYSHADDSKEETVMHTIMWLSDPFVNASTSITYFFDIPPDIINDCCYEISIELPFEFFDLTQILNSSNNSEYLIENIWVNQKKLADYDEYAVSFFPITNQKYMKSFICVKGFEEEVDSLTVTLGKDLKIIPIKEGTFSSRETSIFASVRYEARYIHIFSEKMMLTGCPRSRIHPKQT